MKVPVIPITVIFALNICSAIADPMPVGLDTMPLQGGPIRPMPDGVKSATCVHEAAARTTNVVVKPSQTPNIAHNCNKDLHSPGSVKPYAKNLATADTPGVTHACGKDVHDVRCVKKCVIGTTEVKPTGPPPIWHVRGGSAFLVRDVPAENALLDRIYNQQVKAKLINNRSN